jgi:hypothetical protein
MLNQSVSARAKVALDLLLKAIREDSQDVVDFVGATILAENLWQHYSSDDGSAFASAEDFTAAVQKDYFREPGAAPGENRSCYSIDWADDCLAPGAAPSPITASASAVARLGLLSPMEEERFQELRSQARLSASLVELEKNMAALRG